MGLTLMQISFSQKNYLPGYIITLKGDTLQGFIDYRDWRINPEIIYFKEKTNSQENSYTPVTINEFKVFGQIYVSAIVNSEISSPHAGNLEFAPTLHLKIDTTFLQTVFKANKSLFYFRNNYGNENFYIRQNTQYELLVYKKYLKKREGKNVITENNKYLGQLTIYLSDCVSIQSKIRITKYDEKSLKKLFQYYHECTQSEILYQKDENKIVTDIGILAGVSISFLDFKCDEYIFDAYEYLVNANYSQSNNFTAGMFFDVILHGNQGKWSIYNELLYTTYGFHYRYDDFEDENRYTITTTEIGYSYIKINNFMRFKYPIGSFYLFLNAGISNGFAIKVINYKHEEIKFYTTEKIVEGNAIDDTRNHEQGYIFGSGIKYKNYSLEMRYEKGNGMSTLQTLNSSTRRYYLLFGYSF